MSEYDYKIYFYEEDGSLLHIDNFSIQVESDKDPELTKCNAEILAENKAEEMMIEHDAHSFEYHCTDSH